MKRKPKIYIAGPMYSSGDIDDNIREALDAAYQIKKAGAIPIVPHLYFFWNLIQPHGRKFWLELDEDWVKQEADALYRLSGKSEGADLERDWALNRSIPFFLNLPDVIYFIRQWNEKCHSV